jgi:hypothetical protein
MTSTEYLRSSVGITSVRVRLVFLTDMKLLVIFSSETLSYWLSSASFVFLDKSRRTVAKASASSSRPPWAQPWLLIREFGSGKATATSLFAQHAQRWLVHNRRGSRLGVVSHIVSPNLPLSAPPNVEESVIHKSLPPREFCHFRCTEACTIMSCLTWHQAQWLPGGV